jgi:hypothetical protein
MEVNTADWFPPTCILHVSLALITLRDGFGIAINMYSAKKRIKLHNIHFYRFERRGIELHISSSGFQVQSTTIWSKLKRHNIEQLINAHINNA